MRVHIPAAALLCAVLVSIPVSIAAMLDGPEFIVLGVSLGLVAASLGVWWYDAARARSAPPPRSAMMASPFAAGAPRMHAALPGQPMPARAQHEPLAMFSPAGMHASLVFAISGLMGVTLFLGLTFSDDPAPVAADAPAAEAADEAADDDAVERVAAEDVPAPAADADAETDAPVPQPAVTANASPAQRAAADAAASASAADSAEPRQATPVELGAADEEEAAAETEPADDEAVPAEEAEEPAPAFREYTVQPGDNMYAIAQRNGLSVTELLVLNDRGAREILHVGDVILLPAEEETLLASSVDEEESQPADDGEEEEEEELLLEE